MNVTRAQEGILSAEGPLAGQASPFHVMVSALITGPLDRDRLHAALDRVTRRHAALRTVFTRDAATGELGSRVLTEWRPTVVEQELPTLPADADPVRVVHRLLTPTAPAVLRPYEAPPVRFVLSLAGPGRAVLTLLGHHVVLDGWSIGLIFEDVAAGYAGATDTDEVPGMELLAEAERSDAVAALTVERAAMLADWPTVLELPSDLDRPAVRDCAGVRLPFTLTDAAREGCVRLAASLGVSRNAVLMGAWVLAVARRTGRDRLLVGIPTVGRHSRAAMRVVGGATGLGPVACSVPEEGTVADYVRATAKSLQASLRYGRVPFEDLATALTRGGDRARNPLAQIAFGAHSELVPTGLPAGEVTFDLHVGHTGGTAYDAMLHALVWDERPGLELEYATSVLTAGEAADLAASFEQALVEMAAAPDGPLAAVTTVTPRQRRRLDALEHGPEADAEAGLWQLIEQAAARTPDAPAVREGDGADQTLTYRQLLEAAAVLSARLSAAGIGAGDRVGLAVRRSAAEIVAIAAVLRIGAAYVGLDPDNPSAATAAVLTGAQATVVLGDADSLAALGPAAAGRTLLDVRAAGGPVGAVPEPAPADPDRIAYLAFTSGTTGAPKGAMIPCRGVVRLAREPRFLRPGATDRFLRLAPLAFDASTLEIFAPLLAGGTVEVFTGRHVTASALAKCLEQRGVTGLWLSAGLFRLVADFRPEAFRSVRQLLTGGDVVPPAQVAAVLRTCPGLRVSNGYGPTENTTFTTVHHVDDPVGATASALPIGRPIQGTGVVVLDHAGRPVPPGGVGELYAYGAGLAAGYTRAPDETALVFGEFGGAAAGCRLYRTGDLVRWDAEGNLRFLGRRDRQVKIRGFRVEPDQVTAVLRAHPEVRDAAVVVVPLGNGDHQLLAAVVGARPGLLDTLRAHAAGRLPGHAVPGLWVEVEQFPVTANGKLDHQRLRLLAAEPEPVPAPVAAPPQPAPQQPVPGQAGDGLEAAIADAWAEVLGHRDFTPADWFFDVGGDSLLLIRVHSILTEALPDHEVTVGDLYACSAIEDLAAKLRADARRTAA
ncbi:non-ribosomal peptide synthetase [Streptacidiphilus pinicola]|uniref:Non-ribosomal peptide synthetase n=1 Tax=Streptacidiphilus pinicola TaxID=2219663 RepID=A0A2X0IR74_9ACTN|nr:non-ribosomal peptide synthetase [Streptacidiphilus pinicola]RAG87117.1 non-ribosomal peptide synthetase [Streptacidiphilus pinicola]